MGRGSSWGVRPVGMEDSGHEAAGGWCLVLQEACLHPPTSCCISQMNRSFMLEQIL